MPTTTSLRYGRIIGGAFLLEAVLFAVLLPIRPLLGDALWIRVVPVGVLVCSVAVSWLMFRRVAARRVLHGFLLGLVATLIYIGLCAMAPGGIPAAVAVYGAPLFWLGQLGRIAGTMVGALTALPRQDRTPAEGDGS